MTSQKTAAKETICLLDEQILIFPLWNHKKVHAKKAVI